MAKIQKIELDGKLIYPATITQAVKDPESQKTQREINEDLRKIESLTGLTPLQQKLTQGDTISQSLLNKQYEIELLTDGVLVTQEYVNDNGLNSFSETNTKYVITEPIYLGVEGIYNVGANSTFHFYNDAYVDGDAGTINFQNTQLIATLHQIFALDNGLTIKEGSYFSNTEIYPEWFGPKSNGSMNGNHYVIDDATGINNAIMYSGRIPVVLSAHDYYVNNTVFVTENGASNNFTEEGGYAFGKSLIIKHNIHGAKDLDVIINFDVNNSKFVCEGFIVVNNPKEEGVGFYSNCNTRPNGTKFTGSSGSVGYSDIKINNVRRGVASVLKPNATQFTEWGYGKGAGVVLRRQWQSNIEIRNVGGFRYGVILDNCLASDIKLFGLSNIYNIYVGNFRTSTDGTTDISDTITVGGGYYTNRNHIEFTDNCHWETGDSNASFQARFQAVMDAAGDSSIVKVSPKMTEFSNNTFIDMNDSNNEIWLYKNLFCHEKQTASTEAGNKYHFSQTMLRYYCNHPQSSSKQGKPDGGMIHFTSAQNGLNAGLHQNEFSFSVGINYRKIDIAKGFNTVIHNVEIVKQDVTSNYPSFRWGGDQGIYCDVVISSDTTPGLYSDNTIKLIRPDFQFVDRIIPVTELPESPQVGYMYINTASGVIDLQGVKKYPMYAIGGQSNSDTLDLIGYYIDEYGVLKSACDSESNNIIITQENGVYIVDENYNIGYDITNINNSINYKKV